jgi:hypothetical protein
MGLRQNLVKIYYNNYDASIVLQFTADVNVKSSEFGTSCNRLFKTILHLNIYKIPCFVYIKYSVSTLAKLHICRIFSVYSQGFLNQ